VNSLSHAAMRAAPSSVVPSIALTSMRIEGH
jgi:hypothetical protein